MYRNYTNVTISDIRNKVQLYDEDVHYNYYLEH